MTFTVGDRIATGQLVGTIVEEPVDGYVLVEWDDEDGPMEDEVPLDVLHAHSAS